MIKIFVCDTRKVELFVGRLWVGDFPTLVDCMLSNGNGGRTWLSEEILFFLTIRGSEETFIIFVF